LNKVFAITPVNSDPFVITWDLGRRCNFDCSYCPTHRHDNFSPYATLNDLKNTANGVFEYIKLISTYRINKDFHISFTGGEPTVNPVFTDFSKFIRNEYEQTYKNNFNLKLSLTTNGAMSKQMAQSVIKNFDYVTVSYHAETNLSNKSNVIDRIMTFKNSSIGLKVNVMFHAEYFEECKKLCETLKQQNVKFIPRLIGDDPDSKSSQAHLYTEDHKHWFEEAWGIEITNTTRPCCGGRTFGTCSSKGTEINSAVIDRNFKGWYCSVNWYFLHIEQQTGLIYHHQTCQATLDGKRGSIGTVEKFIDIINDVSEKLKNNVMPMIVCPNKLCGCGLCTPKSSDKDILLSSMDQVITDRKIFSNV
jgi:MoaA/NifB/PqqE/SkfB family radical SAM enzyme